MSLDERNYPPHKITHIESARLNLSVHYAKENFKHRWDEITPDERRIIREEWGDFMNNSYPFEEGNDDDFSFLDYYKQWY